MEKQLINKHKGLVFFFLLMFLGSFFLNAQENQDQGTISGNAFITTQFYTNDEAIGANQPLEQIMLNSYSNIYYKQGNFEAGIRYEAYLNTLLGFPNAEGKNDGTGIGFRYGKFRNDDIELTVGNFYEQFGSGISFRTYEDKSIGYDNAMDGILLKFYPIKGISLSGVFGRQKLYFDYGPGIIRGIDANVELNQLLKLLRESKTSIVFGLSGVSKFQKEAEAIYNLPENVGTSALRLTVSRSGIQLSAEYANKINDPSPANNYIFKNGEAFILNASYSTKGLGIFASVKRIDNFGFRSDRNASGNELMINYIPDITKNHSYSFAAMYPYVSQPNGEYAFAGEISYKIPRETILGGKYGTFINLNYSRVNSIEKTFPGDNQYLFDPTVSGTEGYESDFFSIGEVKFYHDLNLSVQKKISKSLKGSISYQNTFYNDSVLQGSLSAKHEKIKAHIAILDLTYKFRTKQSLRIETQVLFTKEDYGNWFMAALEYNHAPYWFVSIIDQYNQGNKVHYPLLGVGYKKNTNRFELNIGRNRPGITCVGGICTYKPASSGITFIFTSSF